MPIRGAKGFTLIELLVAIGIATGLLAAIYMAINATQRHSTSIERRVTAQQDVKPALELMAMEIGMASYNRLQAAGLWVNPTNANCFDTTTATQTYRGIQEATADSILVEMDIGGSSGGDGNGLLGEPNEVIRYNYNTANQYITRETNCGGGQPFLGDTVAGRKTVRVINDTLGIPVFRYFDGAGIEIASTSLPAGIPNIRRIEIVLAVETEFNDANTGQPKRLIYSTSVIPRNHAIQQ